MVGLEDFLTEHSYIGGHIPTSDDSNVYGVLIKEYPQFRPSRKDKSALALSAFILPPSSNMRPLHSTFPCIRRWSYHISSFSEEERNLFPSSNRDVGEVLHEFGTRLQNREESCKLPELIGQNAALLENVLQEDIKSLSLNRKEHLDEQGKEISDKEDDLSYSADEGSLHAKETDEGEEADIEDGNDSEEFRSGNSDEECLSESDRNEDGVCFDHDENDNVDVSFDHNEDDDDDEGWITPCNVKRYKLKEKNLPAKEEEQDKNVLVACVTSDFAVQNVLKHIGLSVMGVEGKIIREIKTFTLRCHACFKLCSDMTKIFCPKCGNKTLKRVAVKINPDGTQKVWINFKKPINTRGMIFTLPKPRGGQHARNPILVADQKEARQFSSKMSKKKINPLHEDYDPDSAPFAVRDVYSRAAQLGYMGDKCHNHYYWERKNPNERTKKYKKKK
ncbi:RNA-binding protein NOB1-like isoform X4 [Macrobrachium rosenbergii]|uniref:RNA-binding protein NOB1-like isoform X4 n=1 Tax=Macrobrachium rosenbergii TaxID=79674 RepID=UPI0034D405EB